VINKKCDDGMMRGREEREYERKKLEEDKRQVVCKCKWIKKKEKKRHTKEKSAFRARFFRVLSSLLAKVYKESHHHHHHVIISDDDVPLDECRSRDPGDVLFLHLFFFFFVFLLLLLDFIPECIIFSLRDSFFVLLLFLLENTSDEKEEEQLRRRYR